MANANIEYGWRFVTIKQNRKGLCLSSSDRAILRSSDLTGPYN